jgi:soluble cytochrome b562
VLRLYVNFFQPQMKLVAKTRQGAKVTKRFDGARTPYRRVLESPHVDQTAKDRLRAIYLGLNPAQLKRDLAACQARLLEVSKSTSSTRKEVKPPPGPRTKGGPLLGRRLRGHLW